MHNHVDKCRIVTVELQHPFALITPTVDGDVLHVLASANASFSIPQLDAMIARRSLNGIRNAVARLVDQGVVTPTGSDRGRRYALNEAHLAAPAIRQIADLKPTLLRRLHLHVSEWTIEPVFGALFGSGARGTMSAESDLDLLLVGDPDADQEVWYDQLADLTESVTAWTGNDTRIVALRPDETDDASTLALLREVAAHGIPFTSDADWLARTLRRKNAR